MNRRKLIGYYAGASGFIVLINTFFILVMSAIAVYISEEAELSGAEADFEFYSMQLTFVFGMFLMVFHIITGIAGLIKKTRTTLGASGVISLLSGFTAVMFMASCISMLVTKKGASKDSYTLTVILIGLAGAAACLIYSVLAVICAAGASSYGRDTVKINEKLNKITEERVKDVYRALMMFTYTLFMSAFGFMSLYMACALREYAKENDISAPVQSVFLTAIFIAAMISAVNMLAAVIGAIMGKSPADIIKFVMVLSGIVIMAVYAAVAATMLGKPYTGAGYPDITYILFNFVPIILGIFPAIVCIRAWKPSLKRH